MKHRRFFSAAACSLALCAPAARAELTVLHSWDMGESEGGTADTVAGKITDSVGDFDVDVIGEPLYKAIGGGLGVFFNNLDSAHNVGATEYYENAEADIAPADITKWGFEALVRIDVLPANNQELAVFEVGAGQTGISLQTFGPGAWGLHQSNVAITNAPFPVKVGVRQHVLAVRNGGMWELWVDGLKAASFPSADYDPAFGIRIGAGNVGGGNNRGFNGVIDTVRVFEYTDTFEIGKTLLTVVNPDIDNDGFENEVETELGFNPADAASTPESIVRAETALEFSFYARRNFVYRIESSTDLKEWIPVEENIAGLGREIRRIYSSRDSASKHFRAVRIDP